MSNDEIEKQNQSQKNYSKEKKNTIKRMRIKFEKKTENE